jgi:hypothetical protein
MGIKDMIPSGKAKEIIEKVKQELFGAIDKVDEWRDQYKKATTILETFGFTVERVNLKMVPPEINSSFLGSMENIREKELQRMIDEHKDEAVLVALLKVLKVLRLIWEHIEPRKTKVTLHLTLGGIPDIKADLE